jgi:hypothetical protein
MTVNPYESPEPPGETKVDECDLRRQARRAFRASMLVLFFPAVYNYWEFDARSVSHLPNDLAHLLRTANALGSCSALP